MKLRTLLFFLVLPCLMQAQQEELSVPGQNLFVNKINVVQSLGPSLNGTGITVSIKEFGFDTTDVDLRGRVLASPNASTNLTIHANIIASLVGGAGNADLQGRGAAPGCQLVSSSFVGLQPDTDYSTQNITVQNHSYGVDIQNWYGAEAVAYDQTTAENSNLLHVFSAGNKGDSISQSGTYAGVVGFANLTGNFKMAKNVLLVGAVDSVGQVDPRSSRGPAYDGHIKPDLVAFGYDGSSGAAALVSGSAAVIQQTLANDGLSSDLVRAILINAADDIAAPGPDFKSGFGNLNLKNAVFLAFNKNFAQGTISEGQTISLPLNIPDKVRQFKITLAWNDPPAALLAPKALLHDLDFSLLDPLGNEYFPWVLNSFPQLDSLRQPAHRGRDTLNNVEQITIDFPFAGLWEIRVTAPPALNGSQDFALAWSWDTLQHFDWTYPRLNDPTPSNREVILRWENNFPDSFARLEWRPFFSPDWRLIKDSVPLQQGWQRWVLPDTFTEAQVRMIIGGYEFRSEIFLISKALRMKIGFNCPDSVMLFWNAAHLNAQYQLFGLGAKYMEPISIVADTFIVLQKSAFPQPRFAVASLTSEKDALGPRSPAPDISKQGVSCYFHGFLANLNADFGVDLDLTVGTIYGLSKIFFEKQSAGTFVVLDEQAADRLDYSFLDQNPQKGINTYRARLLLNNGATLLSDTIKVYFEGENNWWVFPNPVPSQGVLNLVASPEEQTEFSLFDVLGKLILEKTADELLVEIPLNGLAKGIYFYKVRDGKEFVGGGKLVVE
ncbi:MAG: S8 family peptidase [Phycisphaerae bacterium]|nr:S8 family peptidase [Saprospiraceae bacterium]